MSWKTQTIFVRPAALDGGPEKLLADLGYGSHRKVGATPFSTAGAGSVWIGAFDGCAIIYTPFAWQFFEGGDDFEFKAFKDALLRHFADAEISVLCLNGVVGAWGFAIFWRGALIRCHHGFDGTVICSAGARLPIEEAYLSKCERHDVEGEIRYRDPNDPERDLSDADIGEHITVQIFESLTGAGFDRADKFDPPGANFWLSEEEKEQCAETSVAAPSARSRPWWKIW